MNLIEKISTLILIDIQKGFLDEEYWQRNKNNKNAEIVCSKILVLVYSLHCVISYIVQQILNYI